MKLSKNYAKEKTDDKQMEKRLFITLIAAIISFTASVFAQTPEELIERGNQRIKSKETLFEGIGDLIDAKRIYFEWANKLHQAGQEAKAVELLTKGLAIEIDFSHTPKDKDFATLKLADELRNQTLHKLRAISYLLLDKSDEAIADDTWLIEHKTRDIWAVYGHRGGAYINKDDFEKAIPDLLISVRLNPKESLNYYFLGYCYLSQEKWKLAIANFTKAINLEPKDTKHYLGRALALQKDGQFPKALIDTNTVIRLTPKDADAYFRRGDIYESLKQPAKALADYKKALTLNPNHESSKKAIEELEKKN